MGVCISSPAWLSVGKATDINDFIVDNCDCPHCNLVHRARFLRFFLENWTVLHDQLNRTFFLRRSGSKILLGSTLPAPFPFSAPTADSFEVAASVITWTVLENRKIRREEEGSLISALEYDSVSASTQDLSLVFSFSHYHPALNCFTIPVAHPQ